MINAGGTEFQGKLPVISNPEWGSILAYSQQQLEVRVAPFELAPVCPEVFLLEIRIRSRGMPGKRLVPKALAPEAGLGYCPNLGC